MVEAMEAPDPPASRSQRPYLIALVLAALLSLGLRLRILEHVLKTQHSTPWLLLVIHRGLLLLFVVVMVAFWWLLLGRLLSGVRAGKASSRRQLGRLLQLASGMAVANLLSENLAIYRLNLSSYSLLVDSLVLYLGIGLVFLCWYWYVDQFYRLRGRFWEQKTASSLSIPQGIMFPEEMLELELLQSNQWHPCWTDYVYFTILSSNCFAPPEGHLLVGRPIKVLHILHSLAMINVFIVILARAINTLGG